MWCLHPDCLESLERFATTKELAAHTKAAHTKPAHTVRFDLPEVVHCLHCDDEFPTRLAMLKHRKRAHRHVRLP